MDYLSNDKMNIINYPLIKPELQVTIGGFFMRKNYIYAFLTVAVWSTTAAISKLLLLDIPTFETLAVSGFLAFLFLLILNIKNKTAKK